MQLVPLDKALSLKTVVLGFKDIEILFTQNKLLGLIVVLLPQSFHLIPQIYSG